MERDDLSVVDAEVFWADVSWLTAAVSNGDIGVLIVAVSDDDVVLVAAVFDGDIGAAVEVSTPDECLSMVPVVAGRVVIRATAIAVRALMTASAIAITGGWEFVSLAIISLVDETLHGLLKQSGLMHGISDNQVVILPAVAIVLSFD